MEQSLESKGLHNRVLSGTLSLQEVFQRMPQPPFIKNLTILWAPQPEQDNAIEDKMHCFVVHFRVQYLRSGWDYELWAVKARISLPPASAGRELRRNMFVCIPSWWVSVDHNNTGLNCISPSTLHIVEKGTCLCPPYSCQHNPGWVEHAVTPLCQGGSASEAPTVMKSWEKMTVDTLWSSRVETELLDFVRKRLFCSRHAVSSGRSWTYKPWTATLTASDSCTDLWIARKILGFCSY